MKTLIKVMFIASAALVLASCTELPNQSQQIQNQQKQQQLQQQQRAQFKQLLAP